MRLPSAQRIANGLRRSLTATRMAVDSALARPSEDLRYGRVIEVTPTALRAVLPRVALGEQCHLVGCGLDAEVIAVEGDHAWLSPYAEPRGVAAGCLVLPTGAACRVSVGEYLLGHVLDGLGRPVDGAKPALPCADTHNRGCEVRDLECAPPPPLTRAPIDTPMPLGVRAIDGMLTCGRGQRMGIFAAAGGGKSTLMGMLCDGARVDVVVLALIGERGREVREFLEHVLTPQARARAVVVVSTSDRPALERIKAAYTATTIAEYFRDQGQEVLLLMDSLTRFGRAAREIGMAAGEPLTASGFPPSFFARLPRLLERAGPAARGSITAFYTVLVEGDNLNEPLADEVRSILDGHIVLSRQLAQENHYPAIDVSASVSRVMTQICDPAHGRDAGRLRRLQALYREVALLVRVGEYQHGQDRETDDALARREAIAAFLCQSTDERTDFEETLAWLSETVN
ncbi:EscN/YscN/HrcN family type III secretion system ATPase [Pandoraea terrae]|uniref:EscN/YscN/HrcN family type III secretion system ATPase n=1 Tax=Pandoraea terrae TaxID=1537710 RepID=A0A5E4ZDJ5_9BURK|nr:EscN/YscN/HrcN family type III secretion system ATPase [Pandoraea terrae]